MRFIVIIEFFAAMGFGLGLGARPVIGMEFQAEYEFVRMPRVCECFPKHAASKKYLDGGYAFPWGEWRTYTCEFVCLTPTGELDSVTGTQNDRYRFSDSGKRFLCRGYTVQFVETPQNSERMGYYTIDRISPFPANRSRIPELERWDRLSCSK